MKNTLLTLLVLFSFYSYSQVQNSNEKTIAEFYDADVKRVTLNGGKLELQIKIKTKKRRYIDTSGDRTSKDSIKLRSAEKVDAYFLDVGFTNTKNFLDLDDFDFASVGYKAGFTYQQSFSKIYFDSTYTKISYPTLWTWKLSASVNVDRFDNFDPVKNKIDNVFPVKAGINGGINRYFLAKSWFNGAIIPSLNGKVNFVEYNKLQNFLLNSNSTINGDVVFTENKTFDGKYGVLNNDIQSSIISFSCPFVPYRKTIFTYISPIPHISWETFSNSKPRYNAGFALGFLSKSILGDEKKNDIGDDKKIVPNTFYKAFNAPSFLSFGVDWNFKGGKTKKPQYSISGTFTFK